MNSVDNIRNNLFFLSKKVSKYCVGMEGNISGKIDNESFLIKSSGALLSDMGYDDFVKFDFKQNQLDNFTKKGSMELGFHTFLLGFEGINYVSHTHPVDTVKILCTNKSKEFSNKRIFPDQVIFNGEKSCLVPYSTPGHELTESIKKHVYSFIEKENFFPRLILLENHGIITCGSSIQECIISTQICEKSANIFLGCTLLNTINFLNDDDINKLINDNKEKYRKSLL